MSGPGSLAVLLAAATIGAALPVRAAAQSSVPSGTVTAGKLSFDGHATVGDFTGITTTVHGEMTGGRGLESVRGWVEAPVRTLRTGNGKRDADLNKSLESDKYPLLRFQLDGVTSTGPSGDASNVILHGRFTIHGVTNLADLPGRVLLGSTGARVWADTPLSLKDYRIGGLSKLLGALRMHDIIQVHVDITFASQAPAIAP